MIKGRFVIFLLLLVVIRTSAQESVTNNGVTLRVQSKEGISIKGNYLNKISLPGGNILSDGYIYFSSDFVNDGNPLFKSVSGNVIFNGSKAQKISGSVAPNFNNLIINKSSEILTLFQHISVADSLRMINGNINLNAVSIDLFKTGKIIDENNLRRIYGSPGVIKSKLTLSNISLSKNIGGLGIYLATKDNFDEATIERGHKSFKAGDESITRYYSINASRGGVLDSIRISYFDAEMKGTESRFKIFYSLDKGATWKNGGGVVNTANNYVTAFNIPSFDTIFITIADFRCSKPPLVNLGNDTLFLCGASTITLDAGNPKKFYEWSGVPGNATLQSVQVAKGGKYSVVVTDSSGCTGRDSVIVIEKNKPKADFASSPYTCLSDSTAFTNKSAPTTGLAYSWSFGDGSTSTKPSLNKLYTKAGQYSAVLRVSDQFNCKDSIVKEIKIFPRPVPEFSTKDTCNGHALILKSLTKLSSPTGLPSQIISYNWKFGDGESYTWDSGNNDPPEFINPPRHQYKKAGNYFIELTAVAYPGCAASTGRSYLMNPIGSPDLACIETVRLNLGPDRYLCSSKDFIQLDAGNRGATFKWENHKGIFSTSQTVSIADTGKYWVTVSKHGIVEIDTIEIKYSNRKITAAFLMASIINEGDTVQFVQLSYPDPKNFFWNFADGLTSIEPSPAHTYYIAGRYWVKMKVNNDYCTDTKEKFLVVNKTIKEEEPAILFAEVLDMNLYPNPHTGKFRLEVNLLKEEDILINFVDVYGRQVLEKQVREKEYSEEYDFSNFEAGVYILKLAVGNQVKTMRVVKVD